MATPQEQRRRLDEQRKRLQAQRQSSKPPAVGTKRADGKVYSGQNYGYQSAGSHAQLKKEGKFKTGAQALDRVSQSVSRAIPQPIKNYAKGVAAEGARRQQTKDRVLQRAGVNTNKPDATQRVLKGVSDRTNVDQRIVNTAASVAQAAISKRALRGAAKPQAASKPVPRSVGAAGKPTPVRRELPKVNRPGTVSANRAKPQATPKATQVGKPLGGQSKQIRQTELYSPRGAQGRTGNQYGNGIDASPNKNYARGGAPGKNSPSDAGIDRYRVPSKRLDRTSPVKRSGIKPSTGNDTSLNDKQIRGETARSKRNGRSTVIPNGIDDKTLRNPSGKKPSGQSRSVALLRAKDAEKYRVNTPANKFKPTKAQLRTVEQGRPARSVGAAAPRPNPHRAQPGARLGGPNKRIAFQRAYHGTSEFAAQKIRDGGYVASPGGVFGSAVYTGNKKMARQYADAAGRRLGDSGRVLEHRIPKKNQQNVPFQKPEARQRVSPQTAQVQNRLRQGKTTRIDYGNGSHVTPLTKAQADKSLVKPNGNIRLSKAQQAKVKAQRGPQSSRLGYDNVSKSEAGYFKPGKRQVDTERLAQNIERQLKSSKGGFTVDPRTGKNPTRGTQVAIDGRTLRDTSPEGIRRFVNRNKELLSRPDVKVGGWTSERSGKPVIELSRRVRSRAEAERLGKKFQQEGVWDNKKGQYVPTGGSDQLRQTKGNQTRGGSRIGGKGEKTRLQSPLRQGTVRKPLRSPTDKTQGTRPKRTAQLVGDRPKPQDRGGRFSQENRALAALRANRRGVTQESKVVGKKVHHGSTTITNKSVGVQTTADWKHNPAGGRGRRTEIAQSDTRSSGYQRSGRNDKSPKAAIRSAAAQDQVNQILKRQKAYDTVHGSFESENARNLNSRQAQARDRLFSRNTGGVVKGKPSGSSGIRRFEATRYTDGTFKNIDGERVKLKDGSKTLRDLAKFPKLRQNAQGTKTKARISRPDGTVASRKKATDRLRIRSKK